MIKKAQKKDKKLNINSKYRGCSLGAFWVLILLMPFKVSAEIYKCENIKKEIFYNDKPCPVLDEETEIAAVKDPKNGYIFPTLIPSNNKKSKNIGPVEKQMNTQVNAKDKDKADIKSDSDKDNTFKKSNGGDLVESVKQGESTVSSSGRESVANSSSISFDEKSRYIMKVEENTREPR